MIRWGDGEGLFDLFTRTRAIRRGIVERRSGYGGAGLRPPCGRDRRDGFVTEEASPASGADEALWVFGYGSLMWRPDFAHSFRVQALSCEAGGEVSAFIRMSTGARRSVPGLVLGLDRGGACHGVAFRVDAALREKTIRYLRDREQATAVYVERTIPIRLESGKRVLGLTYVADRLHHQYAGRLSREAMLEIVRAGSGKSGKNAHYILETNDHLLAMGVRDNDLEWLSERLRTVDASPTPRYAASPTRSANAASRLAPAEVSKCR